MGGIGQTRTGIDERKRLTACLLQHQHIPDEVRRAKFRCPPLADSEKFTRAANTKVFLRDGKPIRGPDQRLQPPPCQRKSGPGTRLLRYPFIPSPLTLFV